MPPVKDVHILKYNCYFCTTTGSGLRGFSGKTSVYFHEFETVFRFRLLLLLLLLRCIRLITSLTTNFQQNVDSYVVKREYSLHFSLCTGSRTIKA
jgi:hypothetical protein